MKFGSTELLMLWQPGLPEMLIILVIVLVLFGAKKIPDLARGLGEGIRNFKSGMKEPDATPEKPAEEKK